MSLAAVRLGVIIGNPELIGYVRNARLTFDANSVALLFAERLIERPDIVDGLIKAQQEGKDWIIAELGKYGYWCKDCMGNFIFIKPKHDAHWVSKRLEEMNVLVHPYGHPLLKDFIRVSTGSMVAMERFFKAFMEVDK
jgi:histidinol-phosphate aminotransferase